MRSAAFLAIAFPWLVASQSIGTLNLYPGSNPQAEAAELNKAVTDANGSPLDLARLLEQHLNRYPNSPRRGEIVASLYKSACDNNDASRIALYGEQLLAGKPPNELEIRERVIRALLASNDTAPAEKALAHVKLYKADVDAMRASPAEGHTTVAQWADLADRALARASVLEARALGNLGRTEDAVAAARRSWSAEPTAEASNELARWLAKLKQNQAAMEYYAQASSIDDPRASWADRELTRKLATGLFVQIHGNEQGLGDMFLQAWRQAAAAKAARIARYKAMDRNYGVNDPFEFVLQRPGTGGTTLDMSALRGKTVVMDYWATWCLPCIAQHPILERVKQKFAASPDVVFLSLDADDDHSLVAPFVKAQNWNQAVYLEGGLAGLLSVSSLPTVLIIDPGGKPFSRMSGFDGGSFEAMLASRVAEARSVPK